MTTEEFIYLFGKGFYDICVAEAKEVQRNSYPNWAAQDQKESYLLNTYPSSELVLAVAIRKLMKLP